MVGCMKGICSRVGFWRVCRILNIRWRIPFVTPSGYLIRSRGYLALNIEVFLVKLFYMVLLTVFSPNGVTRLRSRFRVKRIIVCLKQAVDVSQLKVDPASRQPLTASAPKKISDFDKNALEEAIKIKEKLGEAEIFTLTVTSEDAKTVLRG